MRADEILGGRLRRGRLFAIVSACVVAAPALALPLDTDAQVLDFFAGQGCAIGPSTRAAAIAEGFDPGALDALAEAAREDPETIETGEWLVLSRAMCEIRPPEVISALRMTDIEIARHFSAVDEFKEHDAPGCFLDLPHLFNELMVTRGWLPDRSNLEYLRFLSENLVSGDLAFYSDDMLITPFGMQATTGACAKVPAMEEIRRSHAVLIENFDRLIRADMEHAVCESGSAPSWRAFELVHEVTGGKSSNAWMAMEIQFIAMGAGWYEGVSATERGIPRPPLCLYPQEDADDRP